MVSGSRWQLGGLASASALLLWIISELLYKRYRSWKVSNLRRKRRLLGIPQSAEAANESADSGRLLLVQVILRHCWNLFKAIPSMPAKLSDDNSTRSNRPQQARSQQQQQKRVSSTTESGSSSSVNKSDGSGMKARGREGTQDTFQHGNSRFPALLRASSLFMGHSDKVESDTPPANVASPSADASTAFTSAVTSSPRTGRAKDISRSTSSSNSAQSTSKARKSNADSRKEQVQQSPSSGKKPAKEAEDIKTKPAVSVRSIGIQVSPPSPDLEHTTVNRPEPQAASDRQPAGIGNEERDEDKPEEEIHEEGSEAGYEKPRINGPPQSSMMPPPPYDDSHRQTHSERSPTRVIGDRLASTAMTTRSSSSSSSSSETSYHQLQEQQSSRSMSSSSSPSRVNRKTRAAINRQTSRAGIPGLAGTPAIHESANTVPADLQSSRDDASHPISPSTSIATSTSVPTSSYVESTDASISGRSASMSISTTASSTASSSRHTLEGHTPQIGGADLHKPYCFHSGFQSSTSAHEARHSRVSRDVKAQPQHYLPTPPESERKIRPDEHSTPASSRLQPSPSIPYAANGQHLLLHPMASFAPPNLRLSGNTPTVDYVMDAGSQAGLLLAYQQQQGQHQQLPYIHSPQGYVLQQQQAQQIQQRAQSQLSSQAQHPSPSTSQARASFPVQQSNLAPPSPVDAPLVFPSLHSPSLLPSSEPTSSRSVSPQPSLQHATLPFDNSAPSASHAPLLSLQQQQRLEYQQADVLGNLQAVQAQLEYNQQAQAQMQAHYLANAQITPQQIYINQLQQQQQQLQQAYMEQARPATPMHQPYSQTIVSPMLSPYGMHIASPISYSPSVASPQMHSPYTSSPATNWSEATIGHNHAGTSGNTALASISTSGGTLRRKTASLTSSDMPSSGIPPPSPLSSSTSGSAQRKKVARRPGARTRVASLNENEQYLLSPNQHFRENGHLDSPSVLRGRRAPPSAPSISAKRRNSANQTTSSRMSQADADEAELADESVVSNEQELLNSLQDISFEDLDPDKVKSTLQGMELVLERRAKELEIAKWKLKCVEVDRRDTQLEHHKALVHFAGRAERAEARIRLLETSAIAAGSSASASNAPFESAIDAVSTVPPTRDDESIDGSQKSLRNARDEERKDEHDPFQPHTHSTTAHKLDLSPHNLTYSMTTPNLTAYEFSQEPSLDYPPYPFATRNTKSKPRRRKRTSEGPSPAISLDFMRRDSLAPMPPSARSVTSKSSNESLSYGEDAPEQSDGEGSEEDDVEIVLDASFSRTPSRSGTISSQTMLATPSGEKSGALGLGMHMQNDATKAPSMEGQGESVTNERQPSYVGSVPSFSFSLLPNSPSQTSDLATQGSDSIQPSSPHSPS